MTQAVTPAMTQAMSTTMGAIDTEARRTRPAGMRSAYLTLLTWGFTVLNSARVLSYLPTLWALVTSGDSSQHSLWTWGMWIGANLTMAGWLYEQHGQRWNRAIAVNLVNATMCACTFVVIAALRF